MTASTPSPTDPADALAAMSDEERIDDVSARIGELVFKAFQMGRAQEQGAEIDAHAKQLTTITDGIVSDIRRLARLAVPTPDARIITAEGIQRIIAANCTVNHGELHEVVNECMDVINAAGYTTRRAIAAEIRAMDLGEPMSALMRNSNDRLITGVAAVIEAIAQEVERNG